MQLSVVQIGNSKGIRIPKAILDQCRIEDEVDLEVVDGMIAVEPRTRKPRQGWEEAFGQMAEYGDDALSTASLSTSMRKLWTGDSAVRGLPRPSRADGGS